MLNEYLGVDNEDESPTASKYVLGVECGIEKVDLSREVPYCEWYKWTIAYVCQQNHQLIS